MFKIIGAKGKIEDIEKFLNKIKEFSKKENITIQAFNADLIYGKNHLISAIKHAERAFSTKTNTTNTLEMEIFLYASGERQIKLAIPKMGIKKGKCNLAIILIGNKFSEKTINNLLTQLSLKKDDLVLDGDVNTLKRFGITINEICTVEKNKFGDLILEKIALVDIIK